MDAIYPSFSFCFVPPFLENAFEIYEDGINITTYSKFLHGELWDERMLAVDYDNVSLLMSFHTQRRSFLNIGCHNKPHEITADKAWFHHVP